MLLYIYSKCSTCRKAVKYLEAQHIAVTVKDLAKTSPSLEELKLMLDFQKGNVKKLFNSSGHLYKEMQLGIKLAKMPSLEAMVLLSKHGMLVKRPFLLGKHCGLVGFNEAEWSRHLIPASGIVDGFNDEPNAVNAGRDAGKDK